MASRTRHSSLVELTKGRWREFRREPSAFFFVIFMPILWMAILGSAFSGRDKVQPHVGWIDGQSNEEMALHIDVFKTLRDSDDLVLLQGSEPDIYLKLKRGQVAVVVRTDSSTGINLDGPGKNSGITLHFDPANQESASAAAVVNRVLQQAAGRKDPLEILEKTVDLPGTRYIDFLIPGLIALSIMTSSLFGTGMLIVSNRRENLLKRYIATPMRPHEYIVSHIFGRFFIFAVEISAILIAGYLMFKFTSIGRYADLLAFALLGTAAFTALAILCASRTSNPATMNGMTNLISLPMMLVSGVWFSRSHFPDWLSRIVEFLPLTPLVDGVRHIALEGASITSLGFQCAILLAYTVLSVVAAKILFKWY